MLAGGYSVVIPWEVVKSIELCDSWDRWDALPIDLLRNPGLWARPVIQLCWTHPAWLTFNRVRGRGISSPILLQPFTQEGGAFTSRW